MHILFIFVFSVVSVSAGGVKNFRKKMLIQYHLDGSSNGDPAITIGKRFDKLAWLLSNYKSIEDKLKGTRPNSKELYNQYFKKYFLRGF